MKERGVSRSDLEVVVAVNVAAENGFLEKDGGF